MDSPWCPLSHGTKRWEEQLGQGHAGGHHGQPHGVPGPMGLRDGMDCLEKAILRDTMDSPMVSPVPGNKGTGWTAWTRPFQGTSWTAHGVLCPMRQRDGDIDSLGMAILGDTMDSPWCPLSHGTKGWEEQLGQGHAGGHHGQPHGTKGQGYRQLGHGQPMAFPVPWDKGMGWTRPVYNET